MVKTALASPDDPDDEIPEVDVVTPAPTATTRHNSTFAERAAIRNRRISKAESK